MLYPFLSAIVKYLTELNSRRSSYIRQTDHSSFLVGSKTTYIRATGIKLPKISALVNMINTINLARSMTKSPRICFVIACSWPNLKASMANINTFTRMKIAAPPAINPVNTRIKLRNF